MELLGFLFSALWMCYIAGLMILWTNYYGFLASVASAGSVVFALFLFWQMSKVVRVLSGVWRK
jgi:predicted anti-sigma-YlaC factor YlaD